MYHASHVHIYGQFFETESSKGIAVERILDIVTDNPRNKEIYNELLLHLYFVKEKCPRLMASLTSLEKTSHPLACNFYNTVEDLKSYLVAGCEKKTFGPETDRMVEKLKPAERITQIKDFNELFKKSLTKLVKHKDIHPAYDYYKAARIFDPR